MSAVEGLPQTEGSSPDVRQAPGPPLPVPYTHVHTNLRRTFEHVQDVVITILMVLLVAIALQALWRLGRMVFLEDAEAPVVLSQVVFILILTELYRTLIFYLREHRVSVALMLEVAMVSVLQHLILREAHEFEWLRVVVSAGLLAVLGGLLALERWTPRAARHSPETSAH